MHDRNQLFELVNRHIQSLVSRIKRVNTVGLDQKLLNDLLHAGLKCPTFNERQKYTLCINSEISSEIVKLPETSKWFPFDSLARKPSFNADIYTVSLHSVVASSILSTNFLVLHDAHFTGQRTGV